jgi:PTH1 family peptidyl-tRNA hydrolase
MKLVVGLGNSGEEYKGTRHNIGFAVLDQFAAQQSLSFKSESKFSAELLLCDISIPKPVAPASSMKLSKSGLLSLGTIIETVAKELEDLPVMTQKVILAKPNTFMNESGTAVSKLMNFYKLNIEDILVVHDDVSLEFGKIRISFDRGAGGQHGVEDIIAKLGGAKNFYRMRIGVGPDPGGDKRAKYVLSKFSKEETPVLPELLNSSQALILDWLGGRLNKSLTHNV